MTQRNEESLEAIGRQVVDASIKIHKALGNGLLESAYEKCLIYELEKRGLRVDSQVVMSIQYEGVDLGPAYRLDLLIEEAVVLEIKAVDQLLPIHRAQLLSYLKLGNFPLGYLLNFHEELMKDGIVRLAHHYYH